MPAVIKLRRTRGWRMPENTVKVDRTTKWGNPLVDIDSESAADVFHAWLLGGFLQPDLERARDVILRSLHQLRGKNLACWCHDWDGTGENPMVCHADVLLHMANGQFQIGDRVRVFQLLDTYTSRDLIGMVGTICEVDPLANGSYNYYVDGHYMHEEELEEDVNGSAFRETTLASGP